MMVKMLQNAYQPIPIKLDFKPKEVCSAPDIQRHTLYAGKLYGVDDEFGELLISLGCAKSYKSFQTCHQ